MAEVQELRVFVSWSGEVSRDVARELKAFIQRVIRPSTVWISTEDISKGTLRSHEIVRGLQDSRVGLIVLTAENVDRPWLHYEAGYLSSYIQSGQGLVSPILLDISSSQVVGPMTGLQLTAFTRDDMRRLVHDVNKKQIIPADDTILNDTYDAFWQGFEQSVIGIRRTYSKPVDLRKPFGTEKVLTQILDTVRALARNSYATSAASPSQMANLVRRALSQQLELDEIHKLLDIAAVNFSDADGLLRYQSRSASATTKVVAPASADLPAETSDDGSEVERTAHSVLGQHEVASYRLEKKGANHYMIHAVDPLGVLSAAILELENLYPDVRFDRYTVNSYMDN